MTRRGGNHGNDVGTSWWAEAGTISRNLGDVLRSVEHFALPSSGAITHTDTYYCRTYLHFQKSSTHSGRVSRALQKKNTEWFRN